jgi:hypothetical protein
VEEAEVAIGQGASGAGGAIGFDEGAAGGGHGFPPVGRRSGVQGWMLVEGAGILLHSLLWRGGGKLEGRARLVGWRMSWTIRLPGCRPKCAPLTAPLKGGSVRTKPAFAGCGREGRGQQSDCRGFVSGASGAPSCRRGDERSTSQVGMQDYRRSAGLPIAIRRNEKWDTEIPRATIINCI